MFDICSLQKRIFCYDGQVSFVFIGLLLNIKILDTFINIYNCETNEYESTFRHKKTKEWMIFSTIIKINVSYKRIDASAMNVIIIRLRKNNHAHIHTKKYKTKKKQNKDLNKNSNNIKQTENKNADNEWITTGIKVYGYDHLRAKQKTEAKGSLLCKSKTAIKTKDQQKKTSEYQQW